MPARISLSHYGTTRAGDLAWMYDQLAATISPTSDLQFNSTFELLVAVVLSAQATDKSVNLATAQLFPVARTPAAILALTVDGLIPYIRTIGLYKNKARNVIALCTQVIDLHQGEVPDNREALEALPGVGRKTANVVLNVAFGHPTIAVDTHVQRVANRLGICRTQTPEQTEQVLLKRTPKQHLLQAHHYLILHGRYTCMARLPACSTCVLAPRCPSRLPK